jgi:lipase chaperone LimK
MANPNIVEVLDIRGKTAVANVIDIHTTVVTNSGGSNKVFKINALYLSNIEGANTANANISVTRSGFDYYIAKQIEVPAEASLDAISKPIYLEEGDSLSLSAQANNFVQAVVSYEEISDQ